MSSFKRNQRKRPLFHGLTCLLLIIVISVTWIAGWNAFKPNTTLHQGDKRSAVKPHANKCTISSISDLSDAERSPLAGERHMVTPPKGGKISLVCCGTTKGSISLLIHERWAPIGVARFLDMVRYRYFETKIPLFRCTDACQFGLAGDPKFTKMFSAPLQDDPMWLPTGKDHRGNERGVKRYPKGYLTYAGGGNNSRSNQFVLTLKPNPFMGGGSPWEVPLGELVGEESFDTISKLYTGYGEKGPPQGLLRREGNSIKVRTEWPLMDYMIGCSITDQMLIEH